VTHLDENAKAELVGRKRDQLVKSRQLEPGPSDIRLPPGSQAPNQLGGFTVEKGSFVARQAIGYEPV
jgi:hypothetical protein